MNKQIFLKVYENKIINRIINNEIRLIHKKKYKNYKNICWKQLIESPELLTKYGYLNLLKLQDLNNFILELCAKIAAQYGHFHILKSIIECNRLRSFAISEIFEHSLSGGHIHIIEYVYSLRGKYCKLDFNRYEILFKFTAQSGNVEVCKWFIHHAKQDHNVNVQGDKVHWFFSTAALYGHIDVLKWAIQYFDNKIPTTINNIWINAIKSKNTELLEFMYHHKQFSSSFTRMSCIEHGNIDVIIWLCSKEEGNSFNIKDILIPLINRGSLKIIEYFANKLDPNVRNHKNLAEWFFITCQHHRFNAIDRAIKNRSFKIVNWINENTDFKGTINPPKGFEW